MAGGRPSKSPGIDFFPVDVDYYQSEAIRFVRSRFSVKGELVVFRLLCEIYKGEGYFMAWNNDSAMLFATDVGDWLSHGLANDIVGELARRGFFNEHILSSFGILTSEDIQDRYLFAVRSRKTIRFIREYWLLDINDKDVVPDYVRKKLHFVSYRGDNSSCPLDNSNYSGDLQHSIVEYSKESTDSDSCTSPARAEALSASERLSDMQLLNLESLISVVRYPDRALHELKRELGAAELCEVTLAQYYRAQSIIVEAGNMDWHGPPEDYDVLVELFSRGR